MPQLIRDILGEVFYKIVEEDGNFENIDKFMMGGKEQFKLVLDICKKAKDVVIFHDKIIAKLPKIEYYEPTIDESDDLPPTGTRIHTSMKLFKPISIAIASTLTSLDITGFSPKLLPMLKSIDHELKEVIFQDSPCLHNQLKACVDIPYVQDGVHIKSYFQFHKNFPIDMKTFAIRCRKLTLSSTGFKYICQIKNLYNSHLSNIRDLTIEGYFMKDDGFHQILKDFATFLSINFPNLEKLNVYYKSCLDFYWKWNEGGEMINFFKVLPDGLKGCVCFESEYNKLPEIDFYSYPGVQLKDEKYYKIYPITNNLSLKIAQLIGS